MALAIMIGLTLFGSAIIGLVISKCKDAGCSCKVCKTLPAGENSPSHYKDRFLGTWLQGDSCREIHK